MRTASEGHAMRGGMIGLLLLQLIGCGGQESAGDRSDADAVVRQEREEPGGSQDEHGGASDMRLTLSDIAMRTAGIRTDIVTVEASGEENALVVPGQVEFDPRRVALISPRAAGRIEHLVVVEGDRVQAGQAVAFLYSSTFTTAQADLIQAVRRQRVLAETPDSMSSRALAEAARRRLRLLGLADGEIARLAETGEPTDFLPLPSPLDGTITRSHVLPGAAVEPGSPVFEVSDASVMDVTAEVPEQSLPLVRVGQAASVSIAAYPGMTFNGHVERMSSELNPETRTIRATVHVPNRAGRLRAGMFATVRLTVGRGTSNAKANPMMSVPATALVTEGDRHFAFVQVGPNTFERRDVEVASLTPAGSMRPVEGRMAVRRGLAVGERIVVEGAFVLKSEMARASLGEHGH